MTDIHPFLKLSAVEQSGLRGYIRPLFFFPLEERSNDVLPLLEAALELTKKAVPILTAELVPDIRCPVVCATPCTNIQQLLTTNGSTRVARAIRKAIIATDKDYIASLVSFLNNIHSYYCIAPALLAGLMDTSVMTTSWFCIPLYGTQWGKASGRGHCDRVRTVHEVSFLPALPNNDMYIVTGLDQKHWERFEQDELWSRYATMC